MIVRRLGDTMRRMKLWTPYTRRQRIAAEAAAAAGCLFPGAVAAWLFAESYSVHDTRTACLVGPFAALLAYAVSSAMLQLIKAPSPELKKHTGGMVLTVLVAAWIASTEIAPAGALLLAFAAMGSLIAARNPWPSSVQR